MTLLPIRFFAASDDPFLPPAGFLCNALLPRPALNFMLIGMAFSATFSNMVSEERLDQIMRSFRPILAFPSLSSF